MKLRRREKNAGDPIVESHDVPVGAVVEPVSAGMQTSAPSNTLAALSPAEPRGSVAVVTSRESIVDPTATGRAGQQLGDVLVLRGLVTHAQVQEALELQAPSGGRLGETPGADGRPRRA